MQKTTLRWVIFGLGVVLLCSASGRAADDAKTYDLRSQREPGQIDQVQATLEAGGETFTTGGEGEQKAKVSVVAKLEYDERVMTLAEGYPSDSVRYYNKAEAVIKGVDDGVKTTLRDPQRLIGVSTDGRQATFYSPAGPLTRDELDLVDALGNTILVDRLLPSEPVAVKGSWKQDDELMAALFGLDLVTSSTVASTLLEVTENSAIVEMAGRVEGSVGGARSVLEMKAKYRFDLRTHRINWFGLAIHERRQPGHVDMGLDLVARVQAVILPQPKSEHLTNEAVAELTLEPTAEQTRLMYQPPDKGWQVSFDRRWYVANDDHDRAVLRFIDNGDRVADCSISTLAPIAPEKEVPLEKFQADIQRALGDSFGQFLHAKQWAGPTGLRTYRVAVAGTIKTDLKGDASEIPMQWHYYRVADPSGRQVVFAMTVEEPMAERLGEVDTQLVESLRFNELKVAAKPAAAKAEAPEAVEKTEAEK